jgi:PAS domain S-box-containing protein
MVGFGVALVILLVVGLVAVHDSTELAALNLKVNQSHEILADTKDVLGALLDSETAIRGFTISDNRNFLQGFEVAQARLGPAIAELQAEATEPEARRLVLDFVEKVNARNARFREGLVLRERGTLTQELMHQRINEARVLMDAARDAGMRLQKYELKLLEQRQQRALSMAHLTNVVVATGSALAIIFLFAATIIVRRDVRARLAIERQLVDTTTLQRAILDSANYSIISVDPDGIIQTFNSAAQDWLQYTPDEVIGKVTPAIFHDREEMNCRAQVLSRELGRPVNPGFEVFVAKTRENRSDESEWTYIRKDGTRFPVLLSITVLYDTWGKITGYLGIASDISEKHEAELALRKAEETFRTLLQESSDIVTILSPSGDIRYLSPAVERILGYEAKKLEGKNVFEYVHPDDLAQSVESLGNTSTTPGYAVPLNLRLRRPDGSYVWVELIANNLLHDPNIHGIVINARDVTARHEMEKMKRDFISTVSHELRTPLTSIHAALGLLASGKLGNISEKALLMLDIAVKNTDRLVRLVNDILDIERMDSGQMQVELKPIDVTEFLAQASETMRGMADAAGVKLKLVSRNLTINADVDRMTQVVTNLLSNAIKFSPRGSTVTIAAEQVGRTVHLSVADQGRGIPEDKLETIFERFQQVDASDSREKGGTGLGLSICRMVIQQHGGRIWATSNDPAGSIFHVELPLRTGERHAAEQGVHSA